MSIDINTLTTQLNMHNTLRMMSHAFGPHSDNSIHPISHNEEYDDTYINYGNCIKHRGRFFSSIDEAYAFEIEYRNTHAMGFINTCCPNYTGNSYSFYCGNSYEINGNVIANISKGGFYEPEVQPYIEDAIRPLKENEVLIIKEDEFDPVMETYLVGYEQITKERAMALLDRTEIEEGFYYIKKPTFKYQKLTKSELLSSPAYIEDRRND